ncbi:MAG: tRNA preQ1(34) S-adenosylmethionine ribosyltransferase-isomerase QueA [Candidatus Cloacimonetes bacterium]|nr:tRNA preQ1(34) S-adenosylmethionine ribosyltransferase-isomerase QueA [Candidatus Cloacimonadota bacterium]
MTSYKLSDFDYYLPTERIAQYPSEKRTDSKLMVLNRSDKKINIDKFFNVINYLDKSDLLVLNETKVIPARLIGRKPTGGKVEIFLLEQIDNSLWKCLVKPGRRLKAGNKVIFGDRILTGEIIKHNKQGERIVKFSFEKDFFAILDKIGEVPLPPYIKREPIQSDRIRYQTIFAKKKGSVAAPTAGLHFDKNLIRKFEEKEIEIATINLKVGLDTFRPVSTSRIENHKMHKEFCEVSPTTAKKINIAKKEGKKIVAVGTTTVRTLESFFENGELHSGRKWTDIFIYPKYKFKIVDKLITNFHLPRSTLLMLVSAFAGYDFIKIAYKKAIEENFRFYSYGDAMLIL